MKSLSSKLRLLFISLLFLSSIISFLLSVIFPNNLLEKEIKFNQHMIGVSVLTLIQRTDLSLDEIMNITSNAIYDVRRVEGDRLKPLTQEELNRLANQEILFLKPPISPVGMTLLQVEDTYISITLHHGNNIFRILGSRMWLSILFYIFIGSLLIALLSKRAIKPILKLTAATKEVAKGNFDVEVVNHSKDEIGQLTKSFNSMAKKLKNIEYLRKDFISSVSHEFKTPIASIQGFAKLLNQEGLSEKERKEYADIIIEETGRLSNLSSNILKLSGLENQDEIENKELFSLDEQIRRTILLLEPEWSKKNLQFDIDLEDVNFFGDEELLHQVWVNLLQNAIKFSYENGRIGVKLYQIGSILKVRISDTGIGMDEETQKRIFEKFYQGDKSHASVGNGLGLSIVKRILDLYGGSIHVNSKVNEGSVFIIELEDKS